MPPELVKRVASIRELGTILLLILVVMFAGIREPRFLQATSIDSILLWVPLLVVVGIGQMMVIVTRGIDVSVGSMVGLCAMVVGMLFRSHPTLALPLGVLAGAAVGLLLGSINGSLIAFARVPPIIATLGTLSAYRGLIFIVSHGVQVDSKDIPDALSRWSAEGPVQIAGVTVPWILVFSLVVCVAGSWFLKRTRPGRDVYAFGSNPEAARLRGVPVVRTAFMVYAITGLLAGLAGVLYVSRFGFVNPSSAGTGFELVVIAAVVIGGTNVVGGSGTVLGVLLGCFLLGAINVALAVLGISETWQQLVYGIVILVAVGVDTFVRRALVGSAEAA
jgi:rhamnose transport system permease protein